MTHYSKSYLGEEVVPPLAPHKLDYCHLRKSMNNHWHKSLKNRLQVMNGRELTQACATLQHGEHVV